MKINLNFIPQNTAPKGAKSIGLYDPNGNKLKNIPLGNLAPKSKGNKLYTFGALSDVHLPYSTGTDDFVRALNFLNNEEKVDFICISGDMGSSGTDDEWASYKNYVDVYSPNTPVHISAGNHDAGTSTPKTYEYPIPYTGNPLYYSFTQGDDVFIIFGMTFGGNPPFSNESLQWLYETLEENRSKRCFVFQHMMRKGHAGDASGRYSWDGLNNTNGQVFLSLMEHYKNVLWFHGHSHCEFEQQDTLRLPNSNYDRAFGCHSIHVSSCCATRNEDNGYDYEDSEGYVVDVYSNGVHLRGRDFVAEKFLPIASYWIDTTLTEIAEKSYVDSYGVIDTNPKPDGITLPNGSELYINQRYSASGGGLTDGNGTIVVMIPLTDTSAIYTLKMEDLPYLIAGDDQSTLYAVNASTMTSVGHPAGVKHFSAMSSDVLTTNADGSLVEVICTPISGMTHLAVTLRIDGSSKVLTEDDLAGIIISLEKDNATDNIVIFDKSELNLNERYSFSSGEMREIGGVISLNPSVEPNTTYKLTFRGAKTDITANYDTLYLVNSDGVVSTVNGHTNIANMTQGVVYYDNYTGVDVIFTTGADTIKIWFSVLFNPAGTYIMNVDELTEVVLTLEKLSTSGDSGDSGEVEPFVNIVPTLLDTDLTNVYNDIGYKKNARVKSTGEVIDIDVRYKTTLTGLIPLEKDGDVLHIRGVDRVIYIDGRFVGYATLYDSTGALLVTGIVTPSKLVSTDKNGDFTILIDYAGFGINEYPNASYIRLQVGEVADKLIITRSQLIEEPVPYTNLLPLSIDANGNDFVGANGEDGYKYII